MSLASLDRLRDELRRKFEELRAPDASAEKEALETPTDPPIVARLIVEIRSDGVTTVARGGLEDVRNGERAALEARGTTPVQLAASLARTLLTLPLLVNRTRGRRPDPQLTE
jgi:hypothetical protein